MHKLDRTHVCAPACLAGYDHSQDSWDDLRSDCKRKVRAALQKLQGRPDFAEDSGGRMYGLRCAYCESAIHRGGHIEHFRHKGQGGYPALTFVWSNLFLVCDAREHCGHYKDKRSTQPYNPADLIKPDVDEPTHFLHFHSSGEVRVRSHAELDKADIRRASETIRVLGLNAGMLKSARERAVRAYKDQMLDDLDEVAQWSPEERQDYLREEIEATRYDEHATAIRHFLEHQC